MTVAWAGSLFWTPDNPQHGRLVEVASAAAAGEHRRVEACALAEAE